MIGAAVAAVFVAACQVPHPISAADPVVALFGVHAVDAANVAECESGGDPAAISDTGDWGLFQINQVHAPWVHERWGWTMPDLLDPVKNTVVARALHRRQGWGPWYMSRRCHGLG